MLCASALAAEKSKLDEMQGYTETMRHFAFSLVVSSAGFECGMVTHSFIRGSVPVGMVYVAVRCGNGNDYLIMESRDKNKSRILTCAQANAIMRESGFQTNYWDPIIG